MASRISNHRVNGEIGRADHADWGNVIRAWGWWTYLLLSFDTRYRVLKQGAHGIIGTGCFDLPPPESLCTVR